MKCEILTECNVMGEARRGARRAGDQGQGPEVSADSCELEESPLSSPTGAQNQVRRLGGSSAGRGSWYDVGEAWASPRAHTHPGLGVLINS